MMQLGLRLYDAENGRFVQRDIISRARWSAYPCADDSPAFLTDPSGKLVGMIITGVVLIYSAAEYVCISNALSDTNVLMAELSKKVAKVKSAPAPDLVGHCYMACRTRSPVR